MTVTSYRFRIRSILTAIAVWLVLSVSSSFGQTIRFDEIEAKYLSQFPEFVHWEGKAPNEEITIGVLGAPNLSNALKQIAKDPHTKRPLRIIPVDPYHELRRMDILYIGSGHRQYWEKFIENCASKQILVVGSEDGFLDAGGCIQFVRRQVNIKFAINLENAEKCRIRLSSKLIALSVKPTK